MTAEELMALPDDGIDREIIRGELREYPRTMPYRNWRHSRSVTRVGKFLDNWLDEQPEPRGLILSGDVGFRLSRDPETLVGVDVAYASADLVARTAARLAFYDGPPVLAVEILSPSDKHEEIVEKIHLYLEAGSVVWIVDPDLRNVTVYRPGEEAQLFNARQELMGDPYLPGFRVPVARLFDS
jgi:Uma2 family endonuclease